MRKSLTLAALLAATLAFSPTVHASPSVTSPGAHLVSTIMSGNGTPYLCTLGFIVRDIRGSQGALTAGHCNRDPESGTVLQRTPNGDVMVGVYVRQEISPGFRDVGFVEFVPEVADVVTDIGGWHVSRVLTAKEIHMGMELCKSGARTDLSCGPVVFLLTLTKFGFERGMTLVIQGLRCTHIFRTERLGLSEHSMGTVMTRRGGSFTSLWRIL